MKFDYVPDKAQRNRYGLYGIGYLPLAICIGYMYSHFQFGICKYLYWVTQQCPYILYTTSTILIGYLLTLMLLLDLILK